MKYRAEIDGLRAFAVVPVVLFHAGLDLFGGGFVGVDVFFVISGYLITTILIEDIDNKRFGVLGFYERRARRILPALFLVMFCCAPLAWAWMPATQMKDFFKGLVAACLFASNMLFLRRTGYFDVNQKENPLLHTWSLAIEEQYYLLFPIFLFLAWRFGKNRVFWTIVVFAAASLALAEGGWRNHPEANFYLAPTRAWELLSGSIAAFILWRRDFQANGTMAFIGLSAILFSIFLYDKSTPFPSVYTLVPVFGAFLIILFSGAGSIAQKILSAKPCVGLGLISYGVYLWHWPMLSFLNIATGGTPSVAARAATALLSLLPAWLTYAFVDRPIRSRRPSPRKTAVLSALLILSGAGAYIVVYKNQGFPARNPRLAKIEAAINDWDYPGGLEEKAIGDISYRATSRSNSAVVFFGDSHIEQYGPRMVDLYRKGFAKEIAFVTS